MENICQEDEKSSSHMIGNERGNEVFLFFALCALAAQDKLPISAETAFGCLVR